MPNLKTIRLGAERDGNALVVGLCNEIARLQTVVLEREELLAAMAEQLDALQSSVDDADAESKAYD